MLKFIGIYNEKEIFLYLFRRNNLIYSCIKTTEKSNSLNDCRQSADACTDDGMKMH